MIRRFNLIEVDLDRYAWLCRLAGMPSAPTSYSAKKGTRFFHLTDRIVYGGVGELAEKFPGENQLVYSVWVPDERSIGDAREMTFRNPKEYFAELDSKTDICSHLVISMSQPGWRSDKRKDVFDFVKLKGFWNLISFGIRGCNIDCYELVSGGEVLRNGDVSRFNFVRGIFGDR